MKRCFFFLSPQTVTHTFAPAPPVVDAEYAVRGPIVARADEISAALARGQKFFTDDANNKVPFRCDSIDYCNVGNPQSMKQRPLTLPREVLALVASPHLERIAADKGTVFSEESIRIAREFVKLLGDWRFTGAYTNTKGSSFICKSVFDFITRRDGYAPISVGDILLTNGASSGIEMVLNALCTPGSGTMIPIPQYPLYAATLTILGSSRVGYELDESTGWSVTTEQLENKYDIATRDGVRVRAMVVINPGNPTGQVLSVETMRDIALFCAERKLLLLADEVYQENAYTRPFTSFYKVCRDLGERSPGLISFHSVSKGVWGECGRRGGYMHLYGIDKEFAAQITKLSSVRLCSNVDGQLMTYMMTQPINTASAAGLQLQDEKKELFDSLARRAKIMETELNRFKGISCQPIQGAMYAFPTIHLPRAYVREAQDKHGVPASRADARWAIDLLDATGVVVVPGSGFGQVKGTYHFRTTILPEESRMALIAKKIGEFHEDLQRRYPS